MTNCELCQFYDYDEENDDYACMADLDEDEFARFLERRNRNCPYFRMQDEYKTARKQ